MHLERFHDALVLLKVHNGLMGTLKYMKGLKHALVSFNRPVLAIHVRQAAKYKGVTMNEVCKALRRGKTRIVRKNGKVYFR